MTSKKSTNLITLVTMRITPWANAWEESKGWREIDTSRVNLREMCSVPVYVCALETMALTVKQQEEESWEWIKRVDKGRMVEMRMEVGVKESFKKKWDMKNWQRADA